MYETELMTAEIGQVFLALAFFAALFQGGALVFGARAVSGAAIFKRAAFLQFAAVSAAFATLTALHATSDFSVLNVVENSHSTKPFVYKLTGVWGNHEGSMLLWILILATFGAAVALSRAGAGLLTVRTLAVQGAVASMFLAFLLFTSNPFARISPAPLDGKDLNPLLQDPGLIIHPPFLYLGYVGYSIVFAFAISGLIGGRIDRLWARAVRPWALASWVFLTIGIALGSWWAYFELGWGGFWAWDPVENASFMPWLAGTALIHSIRVLEVRGAFQAWTVLLAILTFSLSLVGTFLVRSGILTSVHAFAVDPARGIFILAILGAVVGGALALFAVRGPALKSEATFELVSREAGLLANNILLVAACSIVFIGTFYPLFVDVATGERLSIGAPYFNLVFPFFVLPLLLFLAPATTTPWRRGEVVGILRRMAPAALAATAAAVIAAWAASPRSVAAIAAFAFAVWVFGGVFVEAARRLRRNRTEGGAPRVLSLPKSFVAMSVAHAGVAIVVIGVVGAGVWKRETIAYASIGDTLSVGSYLATLQSVEPFVGPNYQAEKATFEISRNGRMRKKIVAERRFYPVRSMQTTEAAVWSTALGDVYFTIGEHVEARGWVVRGYVHPFASWMWVGAAFMAGGGVIGLFPRAKRAPKKTGSSRAAVAAPTAGEA